MSRADIVDFANTWAWPIAIFLIIIILRKPLWSLLRISASHLEKSAKRG